MRTEKEEIELLKSAVDSFAQAMKTKLIEETHKGKRGWDNDHPEKDLIRQIREDAEKIYVGLEPKPATAVDIANRAMMIWYRAYGKALMQAD